MGPTACRLVASDLGRRRFPRMHAARMCGGSQRETRASRLPAPSWAKRPSQGARPKTAEANRVRHDRRAHVRARRRPTSGILTSARGKRTGASVGTKASSLSPQYGPMQRASRRLTPAPLASACARLCFSALRKLARPPFFSPSCGRRACCRKFRGDTVCRLGSGGGASSLILAPNRVSAST